MNIEILKYQYKMGAYSLQDLMNMVENREISEQDFFEITRKYYKILKNKQEKKGDTY